MSDDLISKSELIRAEYKAYNEGFKDGVNQGIRIFGRPKGHWIVVGEEQGAFGIIYKIRKCSNCSWEHSLVIPDNFCPNCGADMGGDV